MNLSCSCYKKLRMEYQINLGVTLIMIITLLLLTITFLVQIVYLFQIVSGSSSIIFTRQEQTNLNNIAIFIQQYFQVKHQQNEARVQTINKFFKQYQNIQNTYQNSSFLEYCLFQSEIKSNYIRYTAAQFCYQSCGAEDHITLPQNNHIIDVFNQSTQLINQFATSYSVNLETIISYADLFETQFYGAYPLAYSVDTYVPNKRLWYINHKAQMEKYPNVDTFYSPSYKLIHLKQYAMSLTNTIYDHNQNKIGISQQMVPMDDENTIQNIPYNAMMLNGDGQIIINAADLNLNFSDITFIYNQSITGFNVTDWSMINDTAYQSNNQDALYPCNSYSNNKLLIRQTKQKGCHFQNIVNKGIQFYFINVLTQNVFISYTNTTLDEQMDFQMDQIQTELQEVILRIVYIQIFGSILLLVISIVISHYIFLPLKQLMNTINNHMIQLGNNLNSELFKLFNSGQEKQRNIFSDLTYELIKFSDILNNRTNIKNPICTQIENFQYDRQQIDKKFSINIDQVQKSNEHEFSSLKVFQIVKQLISEQMKENNEIQ